MLWHVRRIDSLLTVKTATRSLEGDSGDGGGGGLLLVCFLLGLAPRTEAVDGAPALSLTWEKAHRIR